jgi:hypothetical protein
MPNADLDDDVARLRLWLWNVLVDQAVEPTEFIENDRTHSGSPSSQRPPISFVTVWALRNAN